MKREVSIAVLSGGKSSRMRKNKALLKLENDLFVNRIIKRLCPLGEVLLSVDKKEKYEGIEALSKVDKVLVDEHADIGPIEGIYQSLKASSNDYVFVCAVDMPYIDERCVRYLEQFISDGVDCVVMKEDDKVHPLCAIYSKKCLPVLEKMISEGRYRLVDIYNQVNVVYASLELSCMDKVVVKNINTPDEYHDLMKPHVFAVSGIKNSGKTYLIEKLINEFISDGLKVAVIKHDGHDFDMDHEGTDTYRVSMAGACGVGIYSGNRYTLYEKRQTNEKELIMKLQGYDYIILEGMKDSDYPKIEVVRKEVSTKPYCDEKHIICIASDCISKDYNSLSVFDLNDYKGIYMCLKEYFQGG